MQDESVVDISFPVWSQSHNHDIIRYDLTALHLNGKIVRLTLDCGSMMSCEGYPEQSLINRHLLFPVIPLCGGVPAGRGGRRGAA